MRELEKIKNEENKGRKHYSYSCEHRVENINYELKFDKKRRIIEEKIIELNQEKYEFLKKIRVLIVEIDSLNIDVEILSNYDKYFDLTEKIREKIERQENIFNQSFSSTERKITKKITNENEISQIRSKILVLNN